MTRYPLAPRPNTCKFCRAAKGRPREANPAKPQSAIPTVKPALRSEPGKRRGRLYFMIGLVIVTHCGLALEFRAARPGVSAEELEPLYYRDAFAWIRR